ncbi:hypothetical protein THTE_3154 [Thermogutta terrifontis]|uniref:Uncharacterized protein n=1 Tax=Thermogutta terrifontis TaxID=1331910 RepID=A0A286RII6_9BACT|nr:hypothetical protein THTE_3154 [Thermogutta terrifontis]
MYCLGFSDNVGNIENLDEWRAFLTMPLQSRFFETVLREKFEKLG